MPQPKPKVIMVSDGQKVTRRQLEALSALERKGSMKRAAAELDISTPVLHKYVREIEEKTDLSLVSTTSRGTRLTDEGRELLRRFRAYELRLVDDRVLKVAGTVVSERAVLTAATELSDDGIPCRVTIATDEENLRVLDEMRVDCIILDDASYAMERAADIQSDEIGSDMLMLREAGPRYAKLTFGAQRLGFRYLQERGIPHEIARTVFEPSILNRTDLSFFVNKSLVRNGLVTAGDAKDQRWSVHSIIGLRCSGHEEIGRFLEEAREAWLYRKG